MITVTPFQVHYAQNIRIVFGLFGKWLHGPQVISATHQQNHVNIAMGNSLYSHWTFCKPPVVTLTPGGGGRMRHSVTASGGHQEDILCSNCGDTKTVRWRMSRIVHGARLCNPCMLLLWAARSAPSTSFEWVSEWGIFYVRLIDQALSVLRMQAVSTSGYITSRDRTSSLTEAEAQTRSRRAR
jgi:hypothetical protein